MILVISMKNVPRIEIHQLIHKRKGKRAVASVRRVVAESVCE